MMGDGDPVGPEGIMRFLKAAVEQCGEGIAVSDLEGNLLFVNRAFAVMHGHRPEELEGKHLSVFHTPEQLPAVEEANRRVRETGGFNGEVWHVRRDGSVFPTWMHNSLLRDEEGAPIGMIGTMRDITEQKKAEQALQKSEERFKQVAENAQEWIWEVDADGLYTYASPVVEKILGYTPEEIVGRKHFYDLLYPEEREQLEKMAFEVFAQKRPFRDFVNKNVHKNGKTVWLSTSGVPMLDKKGRLLGYRGADTDISERKRAEAALQESEKRLRDFLEDIGDIAYEADNRGIVTYTNKAAEEVTGLSLSDITGKPFFPFLAEESREIATEAHQRTLNGESPEFKLTFQTGRICQFKNRPKRNKEGEIIGVFGIARDVTEHISVMETLKGSMAKYHGIVEAFDGLLFICSQDNRVLFANQRFIEFAGRNPVGEKCYRALYDLEDVCPWCTNEAVLRGETVRWEVKSPKDDRWYKVVSMPISLPDVPVSKMELIQDVTERKQAEMALKRRAERIARQQSAVLALTREDLSGLDSALRKIAETAAKTLGVERVTIWIFSEDRSEIVCIEHYERSEGSHERGKRLRVEDCPAYFRAVDESRFLSADDALADPRTREMAGDYLIPSGITSMLDAPVRLGGKTVGLICHEHIGPSRRWRLDEQEFAGSMADMVSRALASTERKRADDVLRESEAKMRSLLDHSPDVFIEVDPGGRILYINKTVPEISGTIEETIGRTVFDFILPKDHEIHRRALARVFEAGESSIVEVSTVGRGRRTNLYESRYVPIVREGRVASAMLIATDVTDRTRAEVELKRTAEELNRSNRALEEFATVAAHDLQEPLHITISFLKLYERRYGNNLDADARNLIRSAAEGSRRMQVLIKDLLAYSRVGIQGQMPRLTSSEKAVHRALGNLKASIEKSGAAVTHDPLPTVSADALQLTQLFQNLIGNAIKFCDEASPRIHISAVREGDAWVFSVRDNGIGIEPEQAERIFQVFQRLHSPTEYPGTGVGLSISKKIVERHGGRIWAESAPGKGSTFRFTLPVREEE